MCPLSVKRGHVSTGPALPRSPAPGAPRSGWIARLLQSSRRRREGEAGADGCPGAGRSEGKPACRYCLAVGRAWLPRTVRVCRATGGSMVAHDEIGGLLPIKRTIRVLDVNNQSFREQEVRPKEGFLIPRNFEDFSVY